LLKVTNPGTVTAIHTDENNNFLYAFFSLGQCIKGFQTVIRPVIAIDATHLKGAFEGVIYVASCKDGDEHAYPIAFGVGDGEAESSWIWFLERLREAIGEVEGMLLVSDRHASIAKAVSIVYPNVPHCICFFHLKQNLKSRLKGRKELLDIYYRAAYCSTSREFDLEMDKIKKYHPGTYDYLMSIGPERWSRSHCPRRRYQMMTTNIAEVLNNCIQKARRLPITAAMEFLRDMLQRWFHDRREKAGKNPTYLGKAAVGHCKERNEWSLTYHVYPIELTRYLVKDSKYDGLVNIEQRTCTCRNWDLDQLPCDHAIAVARYIVQFYNCYEHIIGFLLTFFIWLMYRFTKTNFNSLCHEYYSTSWMQTAYAPSINPVPHPAFWEVPDEVASMIVLPPDSKRQAGRPKEIRTPSAGEFRRKNNCANCGAEGHNRVRCPNPRRRSNNGQLNTSVTQELPIEPSQPTKPTRRQRACSVCHVLGHNRKTCPLVDHSQPTAGLGNPADGDSTH